MDGLSNYRVRQVLKLHLRDRQAHLMIGLATFLTDDSRTALVGIDALMGAAAQARNTFKTARRELEKDGKLASRQTGVGRGAVTEWTALCLPETAEPVRKGVNNVNRVNNVDPLPEEKGVNADSERGSIGPEKGGQGQSADQQEPRTLNRRAKPSGSAAAAQTAKDQDQSQDPGALRLPQVANSKTGSSRLNEPVVDDAQQFPLHNSESPAAGGNAREGEPAAPARRCEFDGCLTPDKALRDDERYHIGCGLLDRRAKRAVAEAAAS